MIQFSSFAQLLETLLAVANPSQRPKLLLVHIPVLISFLVEDSTTTPANSFKRSLREAALARLTRTGQQFPADFKVRNKT